VKHPARAARVRRRYGVQPRLKAMCVIGCNSPQRRSLHALLATRLMPHVRVVVEELPGDLHAGRMGKH